MILGKDSFGLDTFYICIFSFHWREFSSEFSCVLTHCDLRGKKKNLFKLETYACCQGKC